MTDTKRLAAGQKLLDAANEFWKACKDEGQYGAVQWLTGSNGELVVFTRGEYKTQLLANINSSSYEGKAHYFNKESAE